MSAPTSKRSFWTRSSQGLYGVRKLAQREHDADLRVQLVDRAVGLDARMGLRHAAHVAQMRLAAVAELRVDAGQIHHCGARTKGATSDQPIPGYDRGVQGR